MPAPPGKRRKTTKSLPLKDGKPREDSTNPSAPVPKPAPKAKYRSVIEVEVSSEDEQPTAGKTDAAEDQEKKAEDKEDALPELGPVPSLDFEAAALPEGEGESATEAEPKVEEELEDDEESGDAQPILEREVAALEGEVNSGVAPKAEVLEEEAAEESDEDDMDGAWEVGKFGQDYEDARKALLESETDED